MGDHAQADEYHQNALALYRKTGLRGEADALNGAGETLLATGRPEQAYACHTAALALTRQTGNRPEQARSLTRLAAVFRQQGDYAQAAGYDQQALTIYRQIGDPDGEADALNGAGETLLATGRPDEAHTRHSAALSLARQTGDRYQQARAHHGLASACQATDQLDQARQHWQHALDIYTDLGVPDAARMHASPACAEAPPSQNKVTRPPALAFSHRPEGLLPAAIQAVPEPPRHLLSPPGNSAGGATVSAAKCAPSIVGPAGRGEPGGHRGRRAGQ